MLLVFCLCRICELVDMTNWDIWHLWFYLCDSAYNACSVPWKHWLEDDCKVSGTVHQGQQQGAPGPAAFEIPTLLFCFTNAAEVHLFHSLGMTSAIMRQLAKDPKLKVALVPLAFHFSSLLFLMKLTWWEVREVTCMYHGVNGQVTLVLLKVHGSPCSLPKANMRERKAKIRLWLCFLASASEPALKDKH